MKKDLKWLKNQADKLETTIRNLIDSSTTHRTRISLNGSLATLKELRELINQLDEPETLSEDWIQEHSYNVHLLGTPDVTTVAVPREDLQNLLVPKQGLPVIPKWVADNIESKKRVGTRLNVAMSEFPESKLEKELDIDEHECNEIYARAWLDGYTVEEEPLYRARLKVITDEFIGSYLRTQSSNAEERLKALEIGSKYIHEDYRHLSEFTEDELKRLDIWNSRQWEVEELEE